MMIYLLRVHIHMLMRYLGLPEDYVLIFPHPLAQSQLELVDDRAHFILGAYVHVRMGHVEHLQAILVIQLGGGHLEWAFEPPIVLTPPKNVKLGLLLPMKNMDPLNNKPG